MKLIALSDLNFDAVVSWNKQLQEDEGALVMDKDALASRLRGWLSSGYEAVVFGDPSPFGYALFRACDPDAEGSGIYLRQFFVDRASRRKGLGRDAFSLLAAEKFAGRRLILEALATNPGGVKFWNAVGLTPYSTKFEAHL